MPTISQILYDTHSKTYRIRMMDSTGMVIELREQFNTLAEAEQGHREACKKAGINPDGFEMMPPKSQ
jgi:hypothetical protein